MNCDPHKNSESQTCTASSCSSQKDRKEKMNIHDYIESQTRNNTDQKFKNTPKFENVKRKVKSTKSPRARGQRLDMLDTCSIESYDSPQSSKNMETKNDKEALGQQSFHEIIPSVRETTGGSNTQSNEAIEKRHRERQKAHQLAQDKQISSLDATSTSCSSVTTDSYKTAQQDSFESTFLNQQQNTSTVKKDNSLQRYKKNALIKGLLQDTAYNYPDNGESSTDYSSADFMDASSSSDVQNGMQNLSIVADKELDEKMMYNERIGRLMQSQEDPDFYEHPLSRMKDDLNWRKKTPLARKGTEETETPRQYYMNLDDNNFDFVSK